MYISSPNFRGCRSLLSTEEMERREACFRFPHDPGMANFPANLDEIDSCIRIKKGWFAAFALPYFPTPRHLVLLNDCSFSSIKSSGYTEIWLYFFSFFFISLNTLVIILLLTKAFFSVKYFKSSQQSDDLPSFLQPPKKGNALTSQVQALEVRTTRQIS